MTKVKSKNKTATDANTVLGAVPYEYGAMSSKFRLYATDKLTAYATMVIHYNQSNHLVVIYEPESSKEDMWTSFTGKVSERLDEIFGGEGSFDKYLERFAYMRSGTCRVLKFSTNVSVPFLIYDVSTSTDY